MVFDAGGERWFWTRLDRGVVFRCRARVGSTRGRSRQISQKNVRNVLLACVLVRPPAAEGPARCGNWQGAGQATSSLPQGQGRCCALARRSAGVSVAAGGGARPEGKSMRRVCSRCGAPLAPSGPSLRGTIARRAWALPRSWGLRGAVRWCDCGARLNPRRPAGRGAGAQGARGGGLYPHAARRPHPLRALLGGGGCVFSAEAAPSEDSQPRPSASAPAAPCPDRSPTADP